MASSDENAKMLSQHLDKIEIKVDSIKDAISSIEVTLGKQAVVLEDHTRRSTNLEARILPIEKHVISVGAILKLLAFVAVVAETYRAIKGG